MLPLYKSMVRLRLHLAVRYVAHATTSYARGDTIPGPSPPSVGAPAPRAPTSRRNVTVVSHANTFSRSPLHLPHALRPR